jgi:hypothetical protein
MVMRQVEVLVEKKEMSLVVLMVDYLAKSLGEKTADLLVVTMDR